MPVTLNIIDTDRQLTLHLPEPKESVLHEVVRWQLAKRRRGTAATKTRGVVSGTTAKMYPQKGTGRARHGSYKAPIFVGGGITFGPQPRDYSYTLPKKVRQLGLAMAISARAQEGKMTLVEAFGVNGKTKEFVTWAREHGFNGKERVLLVTDDELARRAARNLPWVGVLPRAGLNAYDILRYDHLVIDVAMFENGEVAETSDAGSDIALDGNAATVTTSNVSRNRGVGIFERRENGEAQ
jgi:large subunit ribosomal protein L4